MDFLCEDSTIEIDFAAEGLLRSFGEWTNPPRVENSAVPPTGGTRMPT